MSSAQDPLYIEFVSRLRDARKQRSLTQSELGSLIGKEQAFVSKVETCERRLDIIETAQICVALGIDIEHALPVSLRQKLKYRVEKNNEE